MEERKFENVYEDWLRFTKDYDRLTKEAYDEAWDNNPNASYDEIAEIVREKTKNFPETTYDYSCKRQSLAVAAARKLGASEEELEKMIEGIEDRGFKYYPEMEETAKHHGYLVSSADLDHPYPNPNFSPEYYELTPEVAKYIMEQTQNDFHQVIERATPPKSM